MMTPKRPPPSFSIESEFFASICEYSSFYCLPSTVMLRTLVALICRALLWVMGWSLLDDQSYACLEAVPRSMVIFSHSSYWDLAIFTLYGGAYPHREHALRTLVTPWPFRYVGGWLRHLGAIESTRVEDVGGGACARIVRTLGSCDKFVFFLSPKGTLRATPWRSGYYHIARQLSCPIFVAGLDYETHRVVVHPPVNPAEFRDEPTLQAVLCEQLSTIVPLYPKGEVMPIREHRTRSVIGWGSRRL